MAHYQYKVLVPPPRPHRRTWITLLVVVAVVVVGAGAFVIGNHVHDERHPATAGKGASGAPVAPPLTVLSTTPTSGATDVPSDQVVSVHLSSPVTDAAGMPSFTPPVTGSWTKVGTSTLTFKADAPFIPATNETLVIPGGASGPRGTDGKSLAAPVTITFSVAQGSTERLQQLLAQLNYLPLAFTPSAPLSSPIEETTAQTGAFGWRWANPPATLIALWSEGYENVITKGAVMNFENQNGMTVDGLAGPKVWSTLLTDVATAKVNTDPYTYVLVTKVLPESLTLYENGAPTLVGIPVNTGAPGADTADGTFPVFEHVTSSRMVGTNPDGSHYDDPDVPWASYFNGGDALHGFVRAAYGFPQSNGCVEMHISDAAKVWPLSPIGTLVTVMGPAS